MILFRQSVLRRISLSFFVVLFFLLTFLVAFQSARARSDASLAISANVDGYLAIYKNSDGEARIETNLEKNFFADNNVCVINY